jgi:hypothetical protein
MRRDATMTHRHYNAMPRLVAAIVGHVFLFAGVRDLALWSGSVRELPEVFLIGVASAATLVFSISLIVRGKPVDKVFGIILSLLPAFCLLGAFSNYLQVTHQ